MISKQEISSASDAAVYHDKSFNQEASQKADNYYVNEKATAHWQGKGAEFLGKRGAAVTRDDFVELLEGKLRNPESQEIEDLAENSKGKNRRPGVDFTVAPPKSVSLAALVGKDERVVDAHLAANERVMAWFEKHASIVRVKDENGQNRAELAGNLLYATVLHETNRENEPHLHSHNVIVNAVYDEKRQEWRSLTNDRLYKLRAQGDVIYKAELAHRLQKLGYEIEHASNGIDFEIKGFSDEQVQTYSSRRAQIRHTLVERGIDPGEASFDARQTAALSSRAGKEEYPRDVLQDAWERTGRDANLDVESVVAAARNRVEQWEQRAAAGPGGGQQRNGVDPERAPTREEREQARADREALRAVSWAIEHLSEREQSFKLTDLEETALVFSRGGMDDIDRAIEQHVAGHRMVEKELGDDGSRIFTTPAAIDSEMRLARNIREGRGQGNVVLTDEAEFIAAVDAFNERKTIETGKEYRLSGEQVNAARNILMHPDTYQGVQGEAGTGKTAANALVYEVAVAKGWEVLGVATSAAAATELEAASGIPSNTIAGYFAERDKRIKATELRLDELRATINANTPLRHSPDARVESHKLQVRNSEVDYGKHRYTFDHQRGEVFRSPDDFRNAVGTFLTNLANRNRDGLTRIHQNATSFAGKAVTGQLVKGVDKAQSIGRKWTSFEKVGVAEAIAARTTLYLNNGQSKDALAHEFEATQAKLANLKRFGNAEGKKTLLVMDESSLTGAGDTEKLSTLAREFGARVVFQGDIKQHESVSAGRAFEQAQQAGIHLSVLEETRRFDNATPATKQAIKEIKAGDYAKAIDLLDKLEVDGEELAATVADRYLINLRELRAAGNEKPLVGVVALTNDDRKDINSAVHSLLMKEGHLSGPEFEKKHFDQPSLTEAEQRHAVMLAKAGVDHLVYRKNYKEIGVQQGDVIQITGFNVQLNRVFGVDATGRKVEINPQRQDFFSPVKLEKRNYAAGDLVESRSIIAFEDKETPKIKNGTRGMIKDVDNDGATIVWKRDGRESRLNNDQLRMIEHSYAHTSFKEQGATNDREIIAVSWTGAKIIHKLASYVAASRAKGNTEIVTSDLEGLRENAGAEKAKTTAVDMQKKMAQAQQARQQQNQANLQNGGLQKPTQAVEQTRPGLQKTPEKTPERTPAKVPEQGRILKL
ncbi:MULTISPECIES: MobF family relaxase [Paraburkholderia]|uniref:Relaxase domain-containing protein n=1 Tax=Paraburkholderia madseniana TaxID=2599607 RepID=A0AAP5BLR3_9BURK|nr:MULTISPECIES: MobF family relaxase [Paraburkholderia]MCX4151011.1 relaxase domain-containing protein [Paraburkholderia madseniana]MDN7153943.1 relaxase domain-containing protein [Paraburkholderia sp. WS6]MDQ6412825.1 relaxase domain-containing protein [Paraburkholderia madseniana]